MYSEPVGFDGHTLQKGENKKWAGVVRSRALDLGFEFERDYEISNSRVKLAVAEVESRPLIIWGVLISPNNKYDLESHMRG